MTLIDINELPQPIYPDQQKPAPAPAAESSSDEALAPRTETPEAPAVKAPTAATGSETEEPTASKGLTKTEFDLSVLLRPGKAMFATVAFVVLGLIGVVGSMGGDDSGSNGSTSGRGGSGASQQSVSDDGLAGTLDQALFFYSSPSNSDFDCMASDLRSRGVSAQDLSNGTVDGGTLASAVASCVGTSTLVQETRGLLNDMYGASYTTDCLVDFFGSLGTSDWELWLGSTFHLDLNGLEQAMFSVAAHCFG